MSWWAGGSPAWPLAQGLLRHGIDVKVVEKDVDLACTGGYKLHLGPPAMTALRELLPPQRLELLLASSVGTQAFELAVRDHRGRLLLRAPGDGAGMSLDVDRVTLRLVLAEGLGDSLLTGHHATGYRVFGDGVVVEMADGGSLDADVVVAADGASSIFTQLLAGAPTAGPTGLVGVAGRSLWRDLPAPTRELLAAEPMLAIGPGGCGLFATNHDPVGRPAIDGVRNAASTREPIAIWGLIAVDELLPPKLAKVNLRRLVELSLELLERRGWSPAARALIDESIVSSVGGVPVPCR